MEPLVDRYLAAVRQRLFLLPTGTQKDIVNELAENIQSQIDDREAQLGRPLQPAELEAVLKRHGHPAEVAARFRQKRDGPSLKVGRELIGPELFPVYMTILCINATLTAVAILVITLVKELPLRPGLFQPLVIQAGIVTLIFVLVGRAVRAPAAPAEWEPRELLVGEPREPHRVSRAESIAELIVDTLLLGWWVDRPPAADGPSLWQDFHHTFYVPVLALLLAGTVINIANLMRPHWTRPRLAARLLVTGGWAVVLLLALAPHIGPLQSQWHLLSTRDPSLTEAQAGAYGLNLFVAFGMICVAVACGVAWVVELVRFVRLKPPPAGAATSTPLAMSL